MLGNCKMLGNCNISPARPLEYIPALREHLLAEFESVGLELQIGKGGVTLRSHWPHKDVWVYLTLGWEGAPFSFEIVDDEGFSWVDGIFEGEFTGNVHKDSLQYARHLGTLIGQYKLV